MAVKPAANVPVTSTATSTIAPRTRYFSVPDTPPARVRDVHGGAYSAIPVKVRRSSILAVGTVVADAACRRRASAVAVAGTVGSVGDTFGVPTITRMVVVAESNTTRSLRAVAPIGFAVRT